MKGHVRTRFAPSPTGELHVGGARTALFNFLFARKHGGAFIIRVEDTDVPRSERAYEEGILKDLRWLGMTWDEGPDRGGPRGPYRQSERLEIYREHAGVLLDKGLAYRCYCSKERLEELKAFQASKGLPPRYDGRCRALKEGEVPGGVAPVIRFRVPERKVSFDDLVHGRLTFDARDIGDFIIIASDGVASYNFAASVDDALMGITHVIRGDDHIPNTPRQVMLLEAMGFAVPGYAHLPLVLGSDRAPLSKRHGASSVRALREAGYLPEAVVNAIARLGWSPGKATEGLMGIEELTAAFDPRRLSRSPSVFDAERLKDFNREAIGRSGSGRLIELTGLTAAGGMESIERVIDAVKKNASTLEEIRRLALPFLEDIGLEEGEREILTGPGAKVLKALLKEAREAATIDGGNSAVIIERVKRSAGVEGRELFLPIRLALTGESEGIELRKVLELLGKNKVIERLRKAAG